MVTLKLVAEAGSTQPLDGDPRNGQEFLMDKDSFMMMASWNAMCVRPQW